MPIFDWNGRWTRALAATLIALLATACGGDGTGPGGNQAAGTFSASISGGLSQNMSGNAVYVVGASGLAIAMTTGGAGGAGGSGIVLARASTALPGVGTYQIGGAGDADLPPEQFFASSIWNVSGSARLCPSASGTLHVTASGGNLAGDFTITVGCLDPSSGAVQDATITGQFNAKQGTSSTS